MPISYGTFTKQLKSLPLTLYADGRASVTIRFGYVDSNNNFFPAEEKNFMFDPSEVSMILDTPSMPGLNRREDLNLALYNMLVQKGLVEAGIIS